MKMMMDETVTTIDFGDGDKRHGDNQPRFRETELPRKGSGVPAHEQHLKSKSHIVKASSLETSNGEEDKKIIKQLPPRRVEKNDPAQLKGGFLLAQTLSMIQEETWMMWVAHALEVLS
ncbi:unnamed protein product [Thlaspi arvense]|uniref:Uncharacterized protein n=1 Tax=Thlaspi arvense TaxID=13288 RepID=A0AAU9RBC9_THLAR|nr:unnamed protein product [Thlaspi arvense]